MNGLDYLFLLVVILSLALGAFRGVVRELLGLGGWVGALVLAWFGAPLAAPLLPDWTGLPAIRWLLAFIIIFILVRALAWGLGLVAAELIKATHLTTLDRILGSAFGLLRGAAIVIFLGLLAHTTKLPQTPLWQGAWLSKPVSLAAQKTAFLLPASVQGLLSF